MQSVANEFIPHPWKGSETYGGYCNRLEEAVANITALEEVPEAAIQALAFIAVEVPGDIDSCSIRPPLRRMKDFFGNQSEDTRMAFLTTALALPGGNREVARIDWILRI